MSFYVYLLLASDNSTYVGATVDLDKRLRQHNKEIKGGAKYTSSKVEKTGGDQWLRVAHVEGFPDWQAALQFEWRWKQLTRKITSRSMKPLAKRMQALKDLLALDRPTSKAKAYSEWSHSPNIVFEDNEAEILFTGLNNRVDHVL
jgi:predicted GIY-YIG superfamily endonuclease